MNSDLMQSYTVNPEQFDSFRDALKKNRIEASEGNSGQIETHGIVISFVYEGTILTLTIVSKPFYIPASMIWSEINSYVPPVAPQDEP